MHIIEAIILGLTQGLTEFIPVSSSGHLILINRVFNLNVGSFVLDAMLNIGTITALLLYFRTEILTLAKSFFNKDKVSRSLALNIAIATLPAVAAGLFIQDFAQEQLRSLIIVVVSLALVGALMLLADRKAGKKDIKRVNARSALLIGVAQILAFIPGVSRSGITITAARSLNFSRETSAHFSFLLALPILSAGILKVLLSDGTVGQIASNPGIFIIGNIASFVSGYLAIGFLLRYLRRNSLKPFAWYRIALASVIALSFMIR